MCGLAGMFGKPHASDAEVMRLMMLFSLPRGKDSTGIFTVDQEFKAEVTKKAVNTPTFIKDNKDDTLLDDKILIMGHNRAATIGKVNALNAHPFEHGDITLCHNGTLISRGMDPKRVFDTDSEGIAAYLGEGNTVADMWASLDGAAALTWWDASTNKFNIIRNDERTLYFVRAPKIGKLYYASELWTITEALRQWGIEHDAGVYPVKDVHFELTYNAETEKVEEVTQTLLPFTRKIHTIGKGGTHYTPSLRATTKGQASIKPGFWSFQKQKSITNWPQQGAPRCVASGDVLGNNRKVVSLGYGLAIAKNEAMKYKNTGLIALNQTVGGDDLWK